MTTQSVPRVQVYKNLHNGKYSVMSLEPGSYGRVIDHADEVVLHEPQFVVQPAGRKRVIKEGRKNVHAFVRGYLGSQDDVATTFPCQPARYNPYQFKTFVDANEQPVYNGTVARLDASGVFYE